MNNIMEPGAAVRVSNLTDIVSAMEASDTTVIDGLTPGDPDRAALLVDPELIAALRACVEAQPRSQLTSRVDLRVDVVSMSVREVAMATSFGEGVVRQAINSGDLVAHMSGVRIVMLTEDVRAWIAAMPRAVQQS